MDCNNYLSCYGVSLPLWANVSGQHTRFRPTWTDITPFLPSSGGFGRTRRRAPAAGWCPCRWLAEGSWTRAWRWAAASSSGMLTHRQWSPSAVERDNRRFAISLVTCSSETALNTTLTSLTNMMGKMVSLINLVLLRGRGREREVRGTSGSTCGLNKDMLWPWGTGAEFSSAPVQLTGSLGLFSGWYWAELSCRHEWGHLLSIKIKINKSLSYIKRTSESSHSLKTFAFPSLSFRMIQIGHLEKTLFHKTPSIFAFTGHILHLNSFLFAYYCFSIL